MTEQLEDLNVIANSALPPPAQIKGDLAPTPSDMHFVAQARGQVRDIIDGTDDRLLVVVGPCSIHDPKAARDYGDHLSNLQAEVAESMLLVMRCYFEKPRTTVGWKGLINDPRLDGSFRIEEGLRTARQLLLDLTGLGLPLATEALDPITPQYLQDLIAWSAIGARTTESQTHREMASGLSCPVGFKNGTDGSPAVAINALRSVSQPHRFLGIDQQGQVSVVETRGNRCAHLVLRGGNSGPNYGSEHLARCESELATTGARPAIMVDCSHANSDRDPERQPDVLSDVLKQIEGGRQSVIGVMLESNIGAGNQPIPAQLDDLAYGVSVTDGCIDWGTTEEILRDAHRRLLATRTARSQNAA